MTKSFALLIFLIATALSCPDEQGCTACSLQKPGTCEMCEDSVFDVKANKCATTLPFAPILRCKAYFTDPETGKPACATCKYGMRFDSKFGVCVPCPANCAHCDERGCFACLGGRPVSPVDGSCGRRGRCEVKRCSICGISDTNQPVCYRCAPGYASVLEDPSVCVKTQLENCQTTSKTSKGKACFECHMGHYLTSNGTCIANDVPSKVPNPVPHYIELETVSVDDVPRRLIKFVANLMPDFLRGKREPIQDDDEAIFETGELKADSITSEQNGFPTLDDLKTLSEKKTQKGILARAFEAIAKLIPDLSPVEISTDNIFDIDSKEKFFTALDIAINKTHEISNSANPAEAEEEIKKIYIVLDEDEDVGAEARFDMGEKTLADGEARDPEATKNKAISNKSAAPKNTDSKPQWPYVLGGISVLILMGALAGLGLFFWNKKKDAARERQTSLVSDNQV